MSLLGYNIANMPNLLSTSTSDSITTCKLHRDRDIAKELKSNPLNYKLKDVAQSDYETLFERRAFKLLRKRSIYSGKNHLLFSHLYIFPLIFSSFSSYLLSNYSSYFIESERERSYFKTVEPLH